MNQVGQIFARVGGVLGTFLISRITHNFAVGIEGVGTILPFEALLRDAWTVFLTGFGERRGLGVWHT